MSKKIAFIHNGKRYTSAEFSLLIKDSHTQHRDLLPNPTIPMNDLEGKVEYFVSEVNRRLIRTTDPYISKKDGETHYLHVYVDRMYHIDKTKKFYYVRDNDVNQHFPKGYVFVKIDTEGNIYLPNGKKPLASVHSNKNGTEYLDTFVRFEE